MAFISYPLLLMLLLICMQVCPGNNEQPSPTQQEDSFKWYFVPTFLLFCFIFIVIQFCIFYCINYLVNCVLLFFIHAIINILYLIQKMYWILALLKHFIVMPNVLWFCERLSRPYQKCTVSNVNVNKCLSIVVGRGGGGILRIVSRLGGVEAQPRSGPRFS